MAAAWNKISVIALLAVLACGVLTFAMPASTARAQDFSGPGWSFTTGSGGDCLSSLTQVGGDTFAFTWDLADQSVCAYGITVETDTVAAEYNLYPLNTSSLAGNPPYVYEQSDTETDTVTFPGPGLYNIWLYAIPDSNTTAQFFDSMGDLAINATSTVTATVTGSETYGATSAQFSETNNAPSGITLSGSVTCSKVTSGQDINATLPVGSYTIDPTSCSGLTAPSGYTLTYSEGSFTVTQASQTISFTAPATGRVGQSATLTATGGGSGNPVTFSVDLSSGNGVCSVTGDTVSYLSSGTCIIDANQAGDANYSAATQVSQTITVNGAPKFTRNTPPLTAVAGKAYSYQFTAAGTPAPVYRLHGAPTWLHINTRTGLVTGTPPKNVLPFSYSVTASNSLGTATAGPFTVAAIAQADMAVSLSCPRSVRVGHSVTCSVTLTNKGPGYAVGAQTAVTLPSDLSEASCSAKCVVNGNFVDWGLASIPDKGTRTYSVTLDATGAGGESTVLVVVQAINPDPKTTNNDDVAVINITR